MWMPRWQTWSRYGRWILGEYVPVRLMVVVVVPVKVIRVMTMKRKMECKELGTVKMVVVMTKKR